MEEVDLVWKKNDLFLETAGGEKGKLSGGRGKCAVGES
jgi:hypothetical protein